MKHANTIVFVIVTAAVLLTAYGVGLLIRQARMQHAGHAGPEQHAGAPNDVTPSQATADDYGPGRGRRQRLGEKDPAEVKQERAEMLEKMSNLTEAEQEQFRQQVRERFSGRSRTSETAADVREMAKHVARGKGSAAGPDGSPPASATPERAGHTPA